MIASVPDLCIHFTLVAQFLIMSVNIIVVVLCCLF